MRRRRPAGGARRRGGRVAPRGAATRPAGAAPVGRRARVDACAVAPEADESWRGRGRRGVHGGSDREPCHAPHCRRRHTAVGRAKRSGAPSVRHPPRRHKSLGGRRPHGQETRLGSAPPRRRRTPARVIRDNKSRPRPALSSLTGVCRTTNPVCPVERRCGAFPHCGIVVHIVGLWSTLWDCGPHWRFGQQKSVAMPVGTAKA